MINDIFFSLELELFRLREINQPSRKKELFTRQTFINISPVHKKNKSLDCENIDFFLLG